MAADKEDRATTGGAGRRAAEAEDRRAAAERAVPRPPATDMPGQAVQGQRLPQYLIALRPPGADLAGAPPQSIDALADYLGRQEDVEIVVRLKPSGAQPFAPNGSLRQEIVVVRMPAAKAESLRATAQPHVIVERDSTLGLADGVPVPMRGLTASTAMLPLSPVATDLALRITGERDQPLARASIVVCGAGLPVQGVTDDSGMARLSLFGSAPDQVRAIYVKPRANHWERLILAPDLGEGGVATIKLKPLTETFPNLAGERVVPWARQLMRFDQAGNMAGAGIRIGIIGSGCDNSHAALRHVARGKDLTARDGNGRRDNGWTDDPLGYGTHSVGLVAAAGTGHGIAGIAPEAELHVLKVFPGGRLSDLLLALDDCIARELDVVSLGVVCDEPSELLEHKLRELRRKGVACVAAAASQPFPAVLPSVLAVGAVGKLREFPADTCHAEAMVQELVGHDGVFPASFTGYGPHVAVAAPGVAVLSTVPGGHAALDGAGIAAAQVAGLAALVLGHHALFQGPLKARSEQRVSALFELIRASAVPHVADPLRAGAGVPNLQRVPGLFGASDLRAPVIVPTADPFPSTFATPWVSPGWQTTLMQMRAAGWIV